MCHILVTAMGTEQGDSHLHQPCRVPSMEQWGASTITGGVTQLTQPQLQPRPFRAGSRTTKQHSRLGELQEHCSALRQPRGAQSRGGGRLEAQSRLLPAGSGFRGRAAFCLNTFALKPLFGVRGKGGSCRPKERCCASGSAGDTGSSAGTRSRFVKTTGKTAQQEKA